MKQALWPDGAKFDVLLLVTDATLYMKKLAEGFYPKLIHATCIVHSLHRVFETIHALYPNVKKLVANGMKIFVKLPATTELQKQTSRHTIPNSSNYTLDNLIRCHSVLCGKLKYFVLW
jgi:hypothetical protein